ncbi:MAG: PTS sugar transporter subunit IIA [Xanthobacteraceae bacterium]|jgi:PTS system nitrogen regulatory IIA component
MNISDFLSPTDVMIDVVAADKQKLLLELARKAGSILDVLPERLFSELNKREELGSTGVGGGVAIPHARFQQVSKPFGMFVRLRKPMDFDAVDGKPVDIVFLLLLPEGSNGEQLGALACIARKLRNPEITAALRAARDSAEIYRTLTAE